MKGSYAVTMKPLFGFCCALLVFAGIVHSIKKSANRKRRVK